MRPTGLFFAAVSISRLTGAWPWPPSSTGGVVARLSDLVRRQDEGDVSSDTPGETFVVVSSDSSPETVTTTGTSDATITLPPDAEDTDVLSSVEDTPTTTVRVSGSSRSQVTTSITSIPQNAQPGGVNMLTPNAQFGSSQYYVVGATVTWVWNYTSLLRAPAYIDVVATVSSTPGVPAPSPFTLAANLTFKPTVTFTWDTGEFASSSPLPVGMYDLNIYDAASEDGPFAIPKAGELQPYDQFPFGVYTPGTYYALEPTFQCATCNAAGGRAEQLTWNLLLGVMSVTIGTMVWFTGVDGVW